MATAIKTIYRDLEYAKSLIKNRAILNNDENMNDEEWTLIGDEDDPEMFIKLQEYDSALLSGGARTSFHLQRRGSMDLGA